MLRLDENKKFDVVTIGSDPEFVVRSGRYNRNAQGFFEHLFGEEPSGECGCGSSTCSVCYPPGRRLLSRTEMGFQIGKAGDIGWDGHSETGEMRPAPSKSPAGHVMNIKDILRGVLFHGQGVQLLATHSTGQTTGGHIHLGHKGADMHDDLPMALSTLALLVVAADGDKKFSVKRAAGRNNSVDDENFAFQGYGRLDDWRGGEEAGRDQVEEFRALSSTWISTPELAYVTLASIGAMFEGLLTLPTADQRTMLKKIQPFQKNLMSLQRLAMLDAEGAIFGSVAQKLMRIVKALPTYKKWEKEIHRAMNAKWQAKEVAKSKGDILTGFGLRRTRAVALYKFLKQEIPNDQEIERAANFYMPVCGPEHGVNHFGLLMAAAQLKLGWMPKNVYYLTGVREKTNAYVVMNGFGHGTALPLGKGELRSETLDTLTTRARSLCPLDEDFSHCYAIGIPFEMRKNLNTKGFMELVWRLEKGQIKLSTDRNAIIASVPKPDIEPAPTPAAVEGSTPSNATEAF